MTDAPVTPNPITKAADDALHFIIFDVALNAAKAAAVAAAPWLGWPIISGLFSWGVDWISGYIYKYLAKLANFAIIDKQVGDEKDAYDTAAANFKQVHTTGDKNAIEKAEQDVRDKLGPLIHFDGT